MTRKRADVVLVERGFFASRARAQEAIAAGLVTAERRTAVRQAPPIDRRTMPSIDAREQPHP